MSGDPGNVESLGQAGLAAAVALLASVGLSWGTLCLGADGHVAFEAIVAGQCLDDVADAHAGHEAAELSPCPSRTGCGPCTDFRGAADAWLTSATPERPDPAASPAAILLAPAALPPQIAAAPVWRRGIPLAATASTVLRC